MRKIGFVFAAAVAITSVTSAAHAAPVRVETGPDYVYVDGEESNPRPGSGFVYAGLGGVCVDDNGNKAQSESPTCVWGI